MKSINKDGEKQWTSGSMKKGRKFGLKLLAEKHHRNYGLELEEILEKAGVPNLSEEEFEENMRLLISPKAKTLKVKAKGIKTDEFKTKVIKI